VQDIFNLEIADVHFTLICRGPVSIEETDPAYQPFLLREKRPGSLEIFLSMELNGLPDTEGMTEIFNTGQSWSISGNKEHYFISLDSPAYDDPLWVAKISRDFGKATIYCSDLPTKEKDNLLIVPNQLRYPLDQLLMMYILAQNKGAIIHAAGINIDGLGYIFPGKSGAGKSTLSRQFLGSSDAEVLSDDRMVIRQINDCFMTYGTPWPGDAGIAVNKGVPLAGIFFLSHSTFNAIEEISPWKAAERLFPVVSIPWYDREITEKLLSFFDSLVAAIPAYILHFTPELETAGFIKEAVRATKTLCK
jgi:hypothetical protein